MADTTNTTPIATAFPAVSPLLAEAWSRARATGLAYLGARGRADPAHATGLLVELQTLSLLIGRARTAPGRPRPQDGGRLAVARRLGRRGQVDAHAGADRARHRARHGRAAAARPRARRVPGRARTGVTRAGRRGPGCVTPARGAHDVHPPASDGGAVCHTAALSHGSQAGPLPDRVEQFPAERSHGDGWAGGPQTERRIDARPDRVRSGWSSSIPH